MSVSTAVDITGATDVSYTPVAADVGKRLRAVLSGANAYGVSDIATFDSAVVAAGDPGGGVVVPPVPPPVVVPDDYGTAFADELYAALAPLAR